MTKNIERSINTNISILTTGASMTSSLRVVIGSEPRLDRAGNPTGTDRPLFATTKSPGARNPLHALKLLCEADAKYDKLRKETHQRIALPAQREGQNLILRMSSTMSPGQCAVCFAFIAGIDFSNLSLPDDKLTEYLRVTGIQAQLDKETAAQTEENAPTVQRETATVA